jgi:hypothetical protein
VVANNAAFLVAQTAGGLERVPWAGAAAGRDRSVYTPVAQGRWWSQDSATLASLRPERRAVVGRVGQIMETELGEMLPADRACDACRSAGHQCWVYSREGAQRVAYSSRVCARCRFNPRKGGCNFSQREKTKGKKPPPGGGNGGYHWQPPYQGPSNGPSGSGGSGIAV